MDLRLLLKKYRTQERMTKKEEKELWKGLVKKADTLFSKFIRNRDKNKNCISYGSKGCSNKIQNACHFISRGYYSHRRDEKNVYGGCVKCNAYNQQEHQQIFMKNMISMYGIEWVYEQFAKKNMKKPKIEKLLEIIEHYNDLLKK